MNLRALHQEFARVAANSRTPGVILGVDEDDCAVVSVDNPVIAITTDFINSSPAIVELGVGGWNDLGRLVACHNLADLAGSGCKPLFFLAGACAPRGTSEAELTDFITGVTDVCKTYGCSLIGGDTKFGSTRAIMGTAIGAPLRLAPFSRKNARAGDAIVVSGAVGTFSAAVLILEHGSKVFDMAEAEMSREALRRIYVPFDVAELLAAQSDRIAGTDISDGLGTDLLDICVSSSLSAILDIDAIPVDDLVLIASSKLKLEPWTLSFASGGDFGCLFSCPQDSIEALANSKAKVIGRFEEGPPHLINRASGQIIPPLGHAADRFTSFSDEILTMARAAQEYHAS